MLQEPQLHNITCMCSAFQKSCSGDLMSICSDVHLYVSYALCCRKHARTCSGGCCMIQGLTS